MSSSRQAVVSYFPCVMLVLIIICQAVALLVLQDLELASIAFFFIIYAYLFFYCFFLCIFKIELNREASTLSSEVFSIPIEEAPPSYEEIFKLNTNPPPYEIAIKENCKELIVEDLPIICVE